jgi:hypothetical protein
VADDPGNDRVNISIPSAAEDNKVKVSANDTTADFLLNKLDAGAGITLTEINDAGDESIQIDGVALTAAAPVNVSKSAAVVGVATDSARADHKHDINTAVAGAISVGDAAAEGVASTIARSDHKHSLAAPAAPADVDASAAVAGASAKVAREDHKHSVSVAAPVDTGTANAAGVANTMVRSDHVHKTQLAIEDESISKGSVHTADFVGDGVTASVLGDVATITIPGGPDLAAGAPTSIEPDDAGVVGVSTDAAREDHQHAIVAAVAGASDHQHSLAAPAAPADVDAAAAATGVSTAAARADHKHDVATAAPVNVEGGTNAEGASNSMSRADHQHRLEVDVLDDAVAVGQRPTMNFTGAGVSVADDVGNDRVNITIPGGGGGGLATKAGCVASVAFAGSPKTATVTFATPFADANYAVTVTPVTTNDAAFDPAVATKLAGSFVINMGSNSINNLTEICWIAVKNGETV